MEINVSVFLAKAALISSGKRSRQWLKHEIWVGIEAPLPCFVCSPVRQSSQEETMYLKPPLVIQAFFSIDERKLPSTVLKVPKQNKACRGYKVGQLITPPGSGRLCA